MVETSTSIPWCRSTCLNNHPFVDDIAKGCDEVDRGSEDGEAKEVLTSRHKASIKDST